MLTSYLNILNHKKIIRIYDLVIGWLKSLVIYFFIIHKIIYCNVAIEKAALLRAVYPLYSVQGHLKTAWPWDEEGISLPVTVTSERPELCRLCRAQPRVTPVMNDFAQAQPVGFWEALNIWDVPSSDCCA